MKIGIISLFNMDGVNFGNRLQAYALNRYIRNLFPNETVLSLYFTDSGKQIVTKPYIVLFFQKFFRKLNRIPKRIPAKLQGDGARSLKIKTRLERHNAFSKKNMLIPDHPWTWDELIESDFDLCIVGSDIVWRQTNGVISKRAFLDFHTNKPFKKIAYGASFGKDWIPKENIPDIKRCLSTFSNISVREKSSVKMLCDIGIFGAEHVADPTLLITKDEWQQLETSPNGIEGAYIFVYLLGREKEVRKAASNLAISTGLPIVTVPFATGEHNRYDKVFGDIRLLDCSIEEWLWLIDHSTLVITDSFHGTVFSTIFEKKFLVLNRQMGEDFNNRMKDFLSVIGEENKFVDPKQVIHINSFSWDYKKIDIRIRLLRDKSEEYIQKSVREAFKANSEKNGGMEILYSNQRKYDT